MLVLFVLLLFCYIVVGVSVGSVVVMYNVRDISVAVSCCYIEVSGFDSSRNNVSNYHAIDTDTKQQHNEQYA